MCADWTTAPQFPRERWHSFGSHSNASALRYFGSSWRRRRDDPLKGSKYSLRIPVDGKELALILAASFMADLWKFGDPVAREVLTGSRSSDRSALANGLWRQSRRFLDASGALGAPGERWTPDLIRRRALLTGYLTLSSDELHLLVLVLQACYAEFVHDWNELCVAGPGDLAAYGLQPKDLQNLMRRLQHIVSSPS